MTKGYIYTMYKGADPGFGWTMNDPIFGKISTLGACMPHYRKAVQKGDYIFVISGNVPNAQQFVVGGFRVQEKLDQITAYNRFPKFRLKQSEDGSQILGNIIIDENGNQHPLDSHSNFEKRLDNYLVGDSAVFLEDKKSIEKSRKETLPFLQDLFEKNGNRVFDIVARGRKLNEDQVDKLNNWLNKIQRSS